MTWYAWLVVAACFLSAALNITSIGKPRHPTTPGVALGVVICNGLIIWAVVSLAAA